MRGVAGREKAEELRTFLHNLFDLNLGESADEIMRDVNATFCSAKKQPFRSGLRHVLDGIALDAPGRRLL